MTNMFDSPFIVPLGAFAVAIVAIIFGAVRQVSLQRLKGEQRMALLARGIPIAEVEAILANATERDEQRGPADPMRKLGNARRAATVLISSGLGLIAFFAVLAAILQVREVLSGAAVGLIPLAIGLGFVVDYRLQKREMSRFGLEVELDK